MKRFAGLGGLLILLVLAGCAAQGVPSNPTARPRATLPVSSDKQLKVDTFQITSPTPLLAPPPAGKCNIHIFTNDCSACCGQTCVSSDAAQRRVVNPSNTGYNGEQFWCDAKPVIYLYPEKPTQVSVTLTVPGVITQSIPYYPNEGWQNIMAYPGGRLKYQGQLINELFYEAAVTPIDPPTSGVVVDKRTFRTQMTIILTQLGLQAHEQQEFFAYWQPRLAQLPGSWLLVSVFDPKAKQLIDRVDIAPKPDTFLEYIFYFKPLTVPVAVEPLQLPQPIPARIGFTAVEWGGIIDWQ